MAMRLGGDDLVFEPVENWEKVPEDWAFIDVAGGGGGGRGPRQRV